MGEKGVVTVKVVLTGGGGTEGDAKMARGGVGLRSAFFDTGDKEAGGDRVPGFDGVAFFLREDFVEACFFVPGEGFIIVSHADFGCFLMARWLKRTAFGRGSHIACVIVKIQIFDDHRKIL